MGRKIFAVTFTICFLTMVIPLSEGENVQYVTFTKHLPNGSTQLFSMKISLNEQESIAEAISRVCLHLLNSDNNMKNYLNQSIGINMVVSAGTGFHFNIPSSFFRSSYFNIIYSLFPSFLFCTYRTTLSTTDIYSFSTQENTTLLVGPHKLMCLGFVGIVGWTGTYFNGYTGFAGFTPFIWYSAE